MTNVGYGFGLIVAPLLIVFAVTLGIVVFLGTVVLVGALLNLFIRSFTDAAIRAVKRARARRVGGAADAEQPAQRARAARRRS